MLQVIDTIDEVEYYQEAQDDLPKMFSPEVGGWLHHAAQIKAKEKIYWLPAFRSKCHG
jgi:hypothetical protein